jgi:predicted metal-dependent HD superfamily phosphohydrolase
VASTLLDEWTTMALSQENRWIEADEFLESWRLLCDAAMAGAGRGTGAALLAVYSNAKRAYHNVHHILDCLRTLAQHSPHDGPTRDCIALAIFFHDAVYDVRRNDNEGKSADLAATWLGAFASPDVLRQVRSLILATRHVAPPTNGHEALVVDIDLSILGRPREIFLAYDAAIRAEYGHVPDEAYRVGRAKVLRGFLSQPQIYQTDEFVKQYEAAARFNLAEAITRLQAE